MFHKRDFTTTVFRDLIKTLINQGFVFQPVKDFILAAKEKCIVLRHDIDDLPENGLALARIENKLGICGTFYFRAVNHVYKPKIIQQVIDCGHEIGYHYEEMDLCNGDADFAIRLFAENLQKFRALYPVRTICMHGSPRSKFDNRDLWKKYDYHNYGIIAEPYFDLDFDKIAYYTDTGRRWDGESSSIRDKIKLEGRRWKGEGGKTLKVERGNVERENEGRRWKLEGGRGKTLNVERGNVEREKLEGRSEKLEGRNEKGKRIEFPRFHSTFDIIRAAEVGLLPNKIMLTIHPQRWHDEWGPWMKELVWQNVKNVVKWGINKGRR